MNGHEGSWLEDWLDDFLARTPPGWPFEEKPRRLGVAMRLTG